MLTVRSSATTLKLSKSLELPRNAQRTPGNTHGKCPKEGIAQFFCNGDAFHVQELPSRCPRILSEVSKKVTYFSKNVSQVQFFLKLWVKRRFLTGRYDPEQGGPLSRFRTTFEVKFANLALTPGIHKPLGAKLSAPVKLRNSLS